MDANQVMEGTLGVLSSNQINIATFFHQMGGTHISMLLAQVLWEQENAWLKSNKGAGWGLTIWMNKYMNEKPKTHINCVHLPIKA